MNGEHKVIFDAIKDNGKNIGKIFTKMEGMETTQTLQHAENVKDIGTLSADVKKFTSHDGQIKAQWVLLVITIGWLVKLSMTG